MLSTEDDNRVYFRVRAYRSGEVSFSLFTPLLCEQRGRRDTCFCVCLLGATIGMLALRGPESMRLRVHGQSCAQRWGLVS